MIAGQTWLAKQWELTDGSLLYLGIKQRGGAAITSYSRLTEDWAQRRRKSRWTDSYDQNNSSGDDEDEDGGKCEHDAVGDSSESCRIFLGSFSTEITK